MNCATADIVRSHQPVGTELSLDAEIPLVHVNRLEVERIGSLRPEERKNAVLTAGNRKRIAARVGGPGTRHLHVGQRDVVTKRCVEPKILIREPDMRPVCESSVSCPQGHTAIAFRIPDKSYPRIK